MQIDIYDLLYGKYKIDKPIRLIELFAGYGSQALALKYLGVNEFNYSFHYVMMKHKELKLPSFESITRARRKLQNKYPELRSSKQVEKARKMKEEEIKNYVLQN